MRKAEQTVTVIKNRLNSGLSRPVQVSIDNKEVIVGAPAEVESDLVAIFGQERVVKITREEAHGPVHSNHYYKILQEGQR